MENTEKKFEKWLQEHNHEDIENKVHQFKTFRSWLSTLTRNERDKVSKRRLFNTFDDKFNRFYDLLLINYCLEEGILEKRYALSCRECNHTLKIIKADELFEELQDSDYCYCCESDIYYTIENIEELYAYVGGDKK